MNRTRFVSDLCHSLKKKGEFIIKNVMIFLSVPVEYFTEVLGEHKPGFIVKLFEYKSSKREILVNSKKEEFNEFIISLPT